MIVLINVPFAEKVFTTGPDLSDTETKNTNNKQLSLTEGLNLKVKFKGNGALLLLFNVTS